MAVKLRLVNQANNPAVRFRAVYFELDKQFAVDLAPGETKELVDVANGSVALTAFRSFDQKVIDTLQYPVSATQGFAAILLHQNDTPDNPRLVGEGFVLG